MILRNGYLSLLGVLPFLFTEAAYSHDCVIREWNLASAVNDMRPIGVSQKFSSREVSQVYVFAALNCLSVSNAVIVKFERDGKVVHEKPIAISASDNYRIWTSVMAMPGHYRVTMEIEGELLNADEFVVAP